MVVGALASILVWLGPLAPPQALGDVLWNNGIVPNGVYSRALSPPAFPRIRVVDDFVIEGPEGWTICSVWVSVVELSGWSSGSELTLYVRADDGGPGDLVREVVAGFDRVATGDEYFGMASYEYLVEDLEIDLCPGTYWLGLRNHDAFGLGTNFWLTSDGGVEGADSDFGWFRRDGGDNWDAEGFGWHRAFVLTGTSSTACGACCLSGGACAQLSPRECAARHGLYRRNGASCESAECPTETRACCLSGDACIDTSPEECVRLGGAAGSEDSDCADEDDNGQSDACESGCLRDPQWICDGDVDGDGQVNPVDSGLVQAAFGSTDESDLCQYDVDCDGQINPVDSGIVQSLFGICEDPREVCP